MEFYWELILWDDTRIQVPPAAVETVKRRWNNGENINMPTRSIPAKLIKDFQMTDKAFTAQPLLEAVSQAFNEPIENEDGIACRWVKRVAPGERWNRHYSHIPAYRKLEESGGMVTMAYRSPIHQINQQVVSYCTPEEVRRLESKH